MNRPSTSENTNTSHVRTVYPPQTTCLYHSNTVISVQLAQGEDVEWFWSHYSDGTSVVTGFRISESEPSENTRINY